MSISFDSAITVNIGKYLLDPQDDSENREINPENVEDNHKEGLSEEDFLEEHLICTQIHLEQKEQKLLLELQERKQREILDLFRNSEERKEDDSPRVIHSEQDQNIEQRIILRSAQPEEESKESETQQADQNQVGFHLTEEDQTKIDRYIRNSTYNSLERYLIFYMDRENRVKIREQAYKSSLWGALFGASGVPAVLNLTSLAINYVYPETALAMKMAKVASYYLSSFAGGAVLGYVVTPLVQVGTMPIRNHPIYHNWRAERIEDEVFKKHRKFLKEQPEFKDLLYCLSGDLIDCPVRDINGNLHDKSIIIKRIEEITTLSATKNRAEKDDLLSTICPYKTTTHLKIQDLSPAPEYYLKLIRSIDRFKERLGEEIPEFSREGINVARESAHNNLVEMYRATDTVVYSLLKQKNLPVEERQKQLEDIKDDLFGANEDAN